MTKYRWIENHETSRLITLDREYTAIVRQSRHDQTWVVKLWEEHNGTGYYYTQKDSYLDRETAKAVAMALVMMR